MRFIQGLLFILLVNTIFFFAQIGMDKINPNSNLDRLMVYEDSMMASYDSGNYTLTPFSASELPTAEAQVNTEGNFFTDMFSTLKSWVLETPGISFGIGVINSFPNFLKACGFAPEIAFALGFLWHCLSVFMLILFLRSG